MTSLAQGYKQQVVNYDHKTIQVRRGSTSEWRRYGSVCIPAEGEICVEFFQGASGERNGNVGMKVGNGSDAYNVLPYLITNQNMDDRISNDQITNWDEAYSWGDHALAGYLTQELDPIFTSSPAATITIQDIENWNEAASNPGLWTEEQNGDISRDSDILVYGAVQAERVYVIQGDDLNNINLLSGMASLTRQNVRDDVFRGQSNSQGSIELTSSITAGGEAYFKGSVKADDYLDSQGNSIINSNGITEEERAKLNEAHGWGNHAEAGYLNQNSVIGGGSYNF